MRQVMDSTFNEVISLTWPTLFIAAVLIITIRVGYLIKHRDEFVFYKELLYLTFILYILCLFQIVLRDDLNTLNSGNNFTLFKEMFRYDFGTRLFYRNIIGNVIMFVPYGFFASLYIDIKKPLSAFLLTLVASVSIEVTQLVVGRVFDVDDIILNIFGGMIGFVLYFIMKKISNILPNFFKSNLFLNIITTLILLTGIFILWR